MKTSFGKLKELAKLIRYFIIRSTTAAGSGHPSSSLSATDLMTVLLFGGFFEADLENPNNPMNDRLIFSKGHAAPLLYSLYAAAGKVSEEELLTLRKFGSRLEGHPTMAFPYTEAGTGSLGQGLSIGVGMGINAHYLDKLPYKTFVLLGDSEFAEGSNYEALELAVHYKLHNLIGILDVNRLGQRGETMYGYKIKEYVRRVKAFGWRTIVVNGHNLPLITAAYQEALRSDKPVMIIAKTIKGKGVKQIENKDGWHGKALPPEMADTAIRDLGEIQRGLRGVVHHRHELPRYLQKLRRKKIMIAKSAPLAYPLGQMTATRQAYGEALVNLFSYRPDVVVLDAETSNSTGAEVFKKVFPERFFEMYIAEQNMVGTALGLSRRGKIPFISTFAAFLSRAHDQIRMSQYSNPNIKFVGSHAGCAIGEDGPSQMALEDIALFSSVQNCVILYPADAVATEALVGEAAKHHGNVYLRTTRNTTPVIYPAGALFPIGGSKVLKKSSADVVTVVAAGITLFEALKAFDILQKENIAIRVIDLYSVKPVDAATLRLACRETKALIVVEDHYPEGGLYSAVTEALGPEKSVPIFSLAVTKQPKSGTAKELLAFEEIDVAAIVRKVREVFKK